MYNAMGKSWKETTKSNHITSEKNSRTVYMQLLAMTSERIWNQYFYFPAVTKKETWGFGKLLHQLSWLLLGWSPQMLHLRSAALSPRRSNHHSDNFGFSRPHLLRHHPGLFSCSFYHNCPLVPLVNHQPPARRLSVSKSNTLDALENFQSTSVQCSLDSDWS